MRIGIQVKARPVKKPYREQVEELIKSLLLKDGIKKAGTHKYIKRVGTKGSYKYYYRLPDGSIGSKEDLKAMQSGKKPEPGKKLGIPKQDQNKLAGEAEGNDKGESKGFKGSVAEGDRVTGKDAYTKQEISGKVQSKGKDGITIVSDKGILHHIKWDGVKSVDQAVSHQDAMRLLMDVNGIDRNWRNGDDGMQPESCDTIGGLLEAAGAARGDFNKLSGEYAEKFAELSPILIKRPELKGLPRIKEKLQTDEKMEGKGEKYDSKTDTYHCRTIRDIDGHTFTLKTIADVSKMLVAFDRDRRIARIKNNFADPTNLGYSDINMNVRLPNGTIAEIQLNTTANLVAKERYGHSLYEVWRTINGGEEETKTKHAELLGLMIDAQKALYKRSNQHSKEGTFKLSNAVQSEIDGGNAGAIFKEENQDYAQIIKPFVEKALPLFEKAVKEGLFPDTDEGKENKIIGSFRDLVERLKNS